jgi:hypothetical protein
MSSNVIVSRQKSPRTGANPPTCSAALVAVLLLLGAIAFSPTVAATNLGGGALVVYGDGHDISDPRGVPGMQS